MAIKFSQFVVETSASTMSHIVGYDGADNIQITPNNFFTSFVTGTTGQVPFFGSTTSLLGDAGFNWDNTNKRLGIGTITPATNVEIFDTDISVLTLSHNGGANKGSRIDFNLVLGSVSQPITAQIKSIDDGNFRSDIIFTTKQFATGSSVLSERMRIDAGGNVGIGTTSPGTTLDVAGTLASSGITQLGTAGSNVLLTSAGAGNVGIGTTSPSEKLQVTSSSNPSIKIQDTTNGFAQKNTLFFNQNIVAGQTDVAKIYTELANGATTSLDNPLKFATAQRSTLTMTDRMVIDNLGNVGIGTNSPQSGFKLDVAGNVVTRGNAYVLNDLIHYGTSDFSINASAGSTAIKFETGGSERMRIDSVGNVGIGTTSPAFKLHVKDDQDSTFNNGIAIERSNSTQRGYLNMQGGAFNIVSYDNVSTKFRVGSNGATTALELQNTGNAIFAGNITTTGTLTVNTGHVNIDSGYSFQWGDSHERIEQSDGKIEFFTNNTEQMTLSGSNLGVGTTSPNVKLDVLGSVRSNYDANNYMQLESNSGGGVLSGKSSGTVTTLVRTYGVSYFNGGSFGIGTTSPSAGAKLEVIGKGDQLGSTGFYVNSSFKDDNNVGVFICHDDTVNNTGAIAGINQLSFITYGSSWGERMKITGSGSVGIGTSSPAKKLHVRGSAPWIRIEEDSASNKRLDLYVDPSTAVAYIGANQSAQQLRFQTGNTDRIAITNGGNVGIGTTAPTAKLTVVGLAEYADNAAAISAGLTTGAFYRTGDLLKVVH